MAYKVVITSYAKHQLEMYIDYTLSEFKSVEIAKEIKEDARKTKKRLVNVAGSLAFCEDEILAKEGYRRMFFAKHDFFMLYRIENHIVIVEAMYHNSQNYEPIFIHRMHLK